MAQVTVYLRDKDVENLKKLVAEFDKKNLLPKNNRSTVTEKILMDYIEMMSEMKIEKDKKVFDRNLIFEYAEQVSETKSKDSKLDREKVELFNSYMERMLARRTKSDKEGSEIEHMRKYLAGIRLQDGRTALESYEDWRGRVESKTRGE
ncbi:hypothetical protein AALT52_10290 [Ligilactobacillus faecis]|uniref:Uncharacterized protein n=1 Tax=Ligilactobacillus faecis TaxID=762833 RepID=A0ABV4DSR9_9LACO